MTLLGEASVMPTYARYPLTLTRGEGMQVWDDHGRAYVDFAGALGAVSLGHGHPRWRRAVHDQIDRLTMVSNLYATEPQAELADLLSGVLPIPDAQVFFCNSGAEANEASLKLVRKHGLARGRAKIVALEGAFHGRSVATLAATGQPAKRAAFEPLVDWFVHVPPNDLAALDGALGGDVAAVLLEPVMGEGGVIPLDDDYLRVVRDLCSERGALLVADEVQSGIGRCGDWLAASRSGVVPDVVSLAKGLGGGLPIGACVARADIAFAPGDHASTFGAGPVPCAAGVAVIETIRDDGLLENARSQGTDLRARLEASVGGSLLAQVRGRGLLVGLVLHRPVAHDVALAMLARGVLVTEAGPDVVRMSPPLIVQGEHLERAVTAFEGALEEVGAAVVGSPA
ncbi:MAG: acetylornithine/succinylornithine family transaminase [Actinomycetota bacterium]